MSSSKNHILTAPEEFVIRLLRARLNNEIITLAADQNIDWNVIFEYCIQQRVLLICYEILKTASGTIPDDFLKKSKKLYHQNAIRNIRYAQEIIQINRKLSSVGVPFILMKGIGLSQILYDDAALRPCVDIDIMVQGQFFSNADKIISLILC